jgi:hypothetical protein
MTHPLRNPRGNGNEGRRRIKEGEPFDPEELSLRLTAHITEQKLKAQLRREARAAKAAVAQKTGVYHHVPKVAATDFERTTTPDGMRHVHKLAHPAAKAHLEHLKLDDGIPGSLVTNLQRTQALDQAVLEKEMLRNRNQFQWDRAMEQAAEADIDRDLFKPMQRTFNEFAHLKGKHEKQGARPLSTGDMFTEQEEVHTRTKTKVAHNINDHRNDWAQQDDDTESKKKDKPSQFLKKKESSWILMGRREKSPKEKDEAVAGIGGLSSPPDSSRKANFLARFKRHPS